MFARWKNSIRNINLKQATFVHCIIREVFEEIQKSEKDESPMLALYQEELATDDSLETLRHIDYVCTQKYYKSLYFEKHELPERARFISKGMCHKFPGVLSEGDISYVVRDMIHMRNELLINVNQHKLVTFPPGTPFDRREMIAQDEKGFEVTIMEAEKCKVKLCFWPAIIGHEDKFAEGPRVSVKEALLESRNFFPVPGKTHRWPAQHVVAKACVIVEEEE
jgi:hypothetical protein